ncbi:MAG: helix-turn-helix domain-containing protein [Gemmatimonadales bacterium]|nr:helix-turn-helix domain-containing protein [Gemmatimonadales bacterium]
MPLVAAWLDKGALAAARRALRPAGVRLVRVATAERLVAAARTRLLEAVLVTPDAARLDPCAAFARDFPAVPLVAFHPFRPDDGQLALRCREVPMALVVEGVDDAVLAVRLEALGGTARRVALLGAAPALLGLVSPLQAAAWAIVVREVATPLRSAELAERLGVSRGHLSRAFAAGGAPNLKRVVDLARIATAADVLRSPGLQATDAVRLFGFASAHHFRQTALRISGVEPGELAGIGPIGVLDRFRRGRGRSRV